MLSPIAWNADSSGSALLKGRRCRPLLPIDREARCGRRRGTSSGMTTPMTTADACVRRGVAAARRGAAHLLREARPAGRSRDAARQLIVRRAAIWLGEHGARRLLLASGTSGRALIRCRDEDWLAAPSAATGDASASVLSARACRAPSDAAGPLVGTPPRPPPQSKACKFCSAANASSTCPPSSGSASGCRPQAAVRRCPVARRRERGRAPRTSVARRAGASASRTNTALGRRARPDAASSSPQRLHGRPMPSGHDH